MSVAFDRFSGNVASTVTEQIQRDTLVAAIPRTVGFRSPTTPQCPVPQPLYVGGNSASSLIARQLQCAAANTAAQNLAVAKLRMIPGCPVNNDTRFIQYQRLPNPAPCPVDTINPAIPKPLPGPCTNVIGICTTWPPS